MAFDHSQSSNVNFRCWISKPSKYQSFLIRTRIKSMEIEREKLFNENKRVNMQPQLSLQHFRYIYKLGFLTCPDF